MTSSRTKTDAVACMRNGRRSIEPIMAYRLKPSQAGRRRTLVLRPWGKRDASAILRPFSWSQLEPTGN